jgi:hypothetical protein
MMGQMWGYKKHRIMMEKSLEEWLLEPRHEIKHKYSRIPV